MDESPESLDWSLVRAFLAVAELGSLSAAARALGSSQPTVGRQIKSLQAQLGADLFHRRTRGFELTETGSALVEPARAMRVAAQTIALAAAGRQAQLEGTVRVTASVAMSVYHLPKIIAACRLAEPLIGIELVPSDDSRNLLYREADIAVRMYRPTQLGLVTRRLGEMPIAVFASKAYLARRGHPQQAEDLLEHDVVGFDRDPSIVDGFRHAGFPVDRTWFKARCDDNAVYWELVRAGCGIGFAQRPVGLADPDMVELDLGLPVPPLPIWLTAHEAMRQTPRVGRVWDLLASGLSDLLG